MMDLLLVIVASLLPTAALLLPKAMRVAQREHYIAGWVRRVSMGWYRNRPLSWWPLLAGFVAAAAVLWVAIQSLISDLGLLISVVAPVTLALAAAVGSLAPAGLRIRGTSAPLRWTARTRRLAVLWVPLWLVIAGVLTFSLLWLANVLLEAYFVSMGTVMDDLVLVVLWVIMVAGVAGALLAVFLTPMITDLALLVMKPVEKALSRKWLVAAQKKIKQVRPTVVAITGSYGKTSTKGYVTHLLQAQFSVVPSPASFNNLLGLSRAVNDKLTPGTEVFVAEMGVYQPGEIRELSESFPPDIAAITVIGEAHLERMRNRETIFAAKAEITEKAKTVVLPIDDPMLAELADLCQRLGKTVVRVSAAGADADVSVDPEAGTLTTQGQTVPVTISGVGHAVNVAVAAGIAFALNVPVTAYADRLNSLPGAAHRAEVHTSPSGALIVDDTYNSNPVGAHRALDGARKLAAERGGRLVVVTPGMIELGDVQFDRNRDFAAAIREAQGDLFVVGYTNRAALRAGFPDATLAATRTAAMAEAFQRAGSAGVILVENDLPDHYA
ncbi:MAG: hypothetical protein RL431_1006 [Actinomycetota bacterium]|jgi:UDP-N-acetylmuramoyl-tripeptide--D-alanyl-D-alanine ligase